MNQEKETVLITGANGLVAKALSQYLTPQYEVRFLTRKKTKPNEFVWDINKAYIEEGALDKVNHIVHLSGAGIADKRWTKKRKKAIFNSRVHSTKLLLETLKAKNIKVNTFISASAIGYYGAITGDDIFKESSPKGNDFLSFVCSEWEQTSADFAQSEVFEKRVILRLGVVLSKYGGALPKMLQPILWNIGAVLGSGHQFMPWIHIDDLCSVITYAIEGKLKSDTYNATAPQHTTNKEITELLASVHQKKIRLPNIPTWVIKVVFGGASILLLKGSRVSSEKLIQSGYSFKFPNLKDALINLK